MQNTKKKREMPKIKHLKVNGLVMQDLKHFNFKKSFKNTLVLSLLVLSLNASAAWHKASGVGTSRNDAVNDAIRNVMLEAGADVRILQSFKDGQIVSSNMDVRGANPIKELVVLEEQSTNNTVTVIVKAFVDDRSIRKCSASSIHKTIVPVSFRYLDEAAHQGSIGIEGINRELDKLLSDKLLTAKDFVTKPMVVANLNTGRNNVDDNFRVNNLSAIAKRNNSQYVIVGTINSVSMSDGGSNFLTNMVFLPTRSISFDMDVYDAVQEQVVMHKTYSGEADWTFDKGSFVDMRSDRFRGSPYGQRVYDLIKEFSDDLLAQLQCAPMNARIIDIDGDDLVINVGNENGLRNGLKFTLMQTASLSGPTGDNYNVYEKSNSVYKVVSVYPHAAKIHPVDLQNNTLNVNVNDVVTLR